MLLLLWIIKATGNAIFCIKKHSMNITQKNIFPNILIFLFYYVVFSVNYFPAWKPKEIFNCNQSGEITIYMFSNYSSSHLTAGCVQHWWKGNELVKGGEFDRAKRDREKGGLSGSWTRNDVVLLPPCTLLVPLDVSLQKLWPVRKKVGNLKITQHQSAARENSALMLRSMCNSRAETRGKISILW